MPLFIVIVRLDNVTMVEKPTDSVNIQVLVSLTMANTETKSLQATDVPRGQISTAHNTRNITGKCEISVKRP